MKMRMRMKILILCLSSTLLALVMQTYLFQKASAALIYNQAKTESFGTLQKLIENNMIIYKPTENIKVVALYLKNSSK